MEGGFEEGTRFYLFEGTALDVKSGVEGPEEDGYGFEESD